MEPRRIVLAVVLMAAVLILTPILFPSARGSRTTTAAADSVRLDSIRRDSLRADATSAPAAASALAANDSARAAAGGTQAGMSAAPGTSGAQGVAGAAGAAQTAGGTAQAAALPVDTTRVSTARAAYRTSSRGAALIGAELNDFRELRDRGRTKLGVVELANPGDRLLAFRVVVPGDTIRLDNQTFRKQETGTGANAAVEYTGVVAGRPLSIRYSFLPDSYRVNVAARIDGAPANSFLLVDMPPTFNSAEADTAEDHNHLAYAYKHEVRSAKGITFASLDPGEREIVSGPLTWAVAKNKYFLLGVLAPRGRPGFAELDVTGGVRTGKKATRAAATLIMPLTGGETTFEVYAGPQEFNRLVAMGREFEESNPYGGFLQGIVQPVATLIIKLLLWMKATLKVSYGWILILFGISVRILLWPLNQKAMRSSMAMQRIQPEMQAIQTKYKGDPQRMQAEMMQLYKSHNMSPFSSLSGCLPMLIPLPIFFALFYVFQNTIEFRGVSFLYLPDISIRDPYFVLPVLVAATGMALSWVGMRGVKQNEQQKMMMYIMPAMFLFIFFNMASGLNLYYLIQNLASIPQQALIARERTRLAPVVR